MSLTTQRDNTGTTVTLEEVFDFNCLEEFRSVYSETSPEELGDFVIDFRQTRYIDSSALGMLIDLYRYLRGKGKITLVNSNPQVKKIFSISRFEKKFTIQ